jgi:hypothetical protein
LRRFALRLIDAASHDPFATTFAPALTALVLTIPFVVAGSVLWLVWSVGGTAIIAGLEIWGALLLDMALWIGAF